MQLNVIREDDSITYVALRGSLDIEGVNHIQDRFVFATTARRKDTLVDVAHVTFIASLGMGMLVGAAKALHRHGARMVLLHPNGMVQGALEAAGIHQVIPIAEREEEALQLLQPNARRPT